MVPTGTGGDDASHLILADVGFGQRLGECPLGGLPALEPCHGHGLAHDVAVPQDDDLDGLGPHVDSNSDHEQLPA